MKNETPKLTTPTTASDAVAIAAKSEIMSTSLTRHHSMDNDKTPKNS
jgi:hypothetical protein